MRFVKTSQTKFVEFNPDVKDAQGKKIFKFSLSKEAVNCPGKTCKGVLVKKPLSGWVNKCLRCGYKINFFTPTIAQQLLSLIQNKLLISVTGTGAGKTAANAASVINHALSTPSATIIVMATDQRQLYSVAQEELKKHIHSDYKGTIWNRDKWVLANNSMVLFMLPTRIEALKGYSASLIWFVEAQGFDEEFSHEATNRLRSQAAKTIDPTSRIRFNQIGELIEYAQDKAQLILEINIKSDSWTIQNIAHRAHTFIASKSVCKYLGVKAYFNVVKPIEEDGFIKDIVAFYFTPEENPYLTEERKGEMRTGKDREYSDQEYWADSRGKVGLAFPDVTKSIVSWEQIEDLEYWKEDSDWYFIESYDFGLSQAGDKSAYSIAIYNPLEGKLIFIGGFVANFDNLSLEWEEIWNERRTLRWTREKQFRFVCDPTGFNSRKTKTAADSMASLFIENGFYEMEPAYGSNSKSKSSKSVEVSYLRLKQLMDQRQVFLTQRFYDSGFKENFEKYKFSSKNSKSHKAGKLEDRNNDGIDAMRYSILQLPLGSNIISKNILQCMKAKIKKNNGQQQTAYRLLQGQHKQETKRVFQNKKTNIFGL